MNSQIIDSLIGRLSRVPGIGYRSARRAVLYLLKNKDRDLIPIYELLTEILDSINTCEKCGGFDVGTNICSICSNSKRQHDVLCVVHDVSDVLAIERAVCFSGVYFVLGGTLSSLDGVGPDEIRIPALVDRCINENIKEVILALNLTLGGQTTAHYIRNQIEHIVPKVTALAQGVPVGGELEYLDENTLSTAFLGRT